MGYQACMNASDDPPDEGNAGAGMGATVGKILGMGSAVKGGIGASSIDLGGGVVVGAIVAVNAFGDVIDHQTGEILAGTRPGKLGPVHIGGDGTFANTMEVMKSLAGKTILKFASRGNTVIGVIATNAQLTKEGANKVAQMSHDGIARAVRPAHTMLDGDTLFALSTGKKNADVNVLGAFGAEVVAEAIKRAVLKADAIEDLPCATDFIK
jgi:L-aminopeptidase/D-esterase-like protein